MLRRGLFSQSVVRLGLFDPVYDKNAGGAHEVRTDSLPSMGNDRKKEQRWNRNSTKIVMRKIPYTSSSVAELVTDAEEAVAGIHRDHLEPRQRRYVNRIGIMLALSALSLYAFTIWRFGQEVFDDVVIPPASDSVGDE
eukprot:TRINITY_DN20694_c0_g1_i1.p1 TRINITY_DN20694_c0_g1~~TRINITY_DN20694_c0_g1_i1.p1  ORF type:complete len:138 (+),score=25.56 TRINITY_DN20694_c0_g1_i1:49-462(+)